MSDDRRPAWVDEHLPPELAGSSLFKFKIKINAKDQKGERHVVDVDMLTDIDLDYEILEDQMQSIPAQYTFWAALYSEVRLMASVAERQLKVRRGHVTRITQKEAAEAKVKLAADQIKVIVEADAELIKIDLQFQNYQMLAGKLWHMVEAIKLKSELARSLAGFKRQEER